MNRNNLQSFSQNHWTGKTDGAHRESSEEWLSKYAHELLAMLPIRGTLLDVGCGSCQVTTYLAREFDQVYGIDFSESMLSAGRERISSLGVRNIELMFGTAQAFPHAIGHPTVILSHAVIQYMPLGDFRRHLYECRRVLAQGGVVCAAQIPNSELKKIYYRGRLVPLQDRFAGRLRRQLELTRRQLKAHLQKDLLWDAIGNWYTQAEVRQVASEVGFAVEFRNCWYSEYRFHAVFTPVR